MNDREKNILAKKLLPEARQKAKKMAVATGLPFDVLYSEAQLAIAMAIRNGDPDRVEFESYAKKYIVGFLYNYLRDKSRIVKIPRQLSIIYLAEKRNMNNQDYLKMSDEEKANLIGCSVDELRESRNAVGFFHQTIDNLPLPSPVANPENFRFSDEYDLVNLVVSNGVRHLSSLTKQPPEKVEKAFYDALAKIVRSRDEEK